MTNARSDDLFVTPWVRWFTRIALAGVSFVVILSYSRSLPAKIRWAIEAREIQALVVSEALRNGSRVVTVEFPTDLGTLSGEIHEADRAVGERVVVYYTAKGRVELSATRFDYADGLLFLGIGLVGLLAAIRWDLSCKYLKLVYGATGT
jgi:hypothetical protein